jgi:hypothetical protein
MRDPIGLLAAGFWLLAACPPSRLRRYGATGSEDYRFRDSTIRDSRIRDFG